MRSEDVPSEAKGSARVKGPESFLFKDVRNDGKLNRFVIVEFRKVVCSDV